MQQAGCQCRATSGNSFNRIVFGMLREDRAAWTCRDSRAPVARFYQGGGSPPRGWRHNLAIRTWRSIIRLAVVTSPYRSLTKVKTCNGLLSSTVPVAVGTGVPVYFNDD